MANANLVQFVEPYMELWNTFMSMSLEEHKDTTKLIEELSKFQDLASNNMNTESIVYYDFTRNITRALKTLESKDLNENNLYQLYWDLSDICRYPP